MTCHDARDWLSDLVDDALEADRRVEIEAHLATCAECRLELEGLRATVAVLRRVERPHAPAGFVDRVMERVHPVPWYRRAAAWLFLPLSVKLPAEAVAIVVIAGLAMLVLDRTPELRDAARPEPPPTSTAPSEAPTPPVPRARSEAPESPPASRAPSRPLAQPAPRSSSDAAPQPSRAASGRSQSPAPQSTPASTEPEARGAPGDVVASAPPGAAAPPGARPSPVAPLARPPAAAESSESGSDRAEMRARSAPQAVRQTLAPAPPPSDLAGRLSVRDRAAASASLANLLSRLGGREVARRQDASDTVIDVLLPWARYDEFIRGLEALGAWTAPARPNVLSVEPPQIRMTIHLTE